jgi:hypothetical protein
MPWQNHRQTSRDDARLVARQSIRDERRDALVLHHAGDDIADHRGAGVAVVGKHDHVAGFRLGQRAEQRHDIRGIGESGQRRPDKARVRRVQRLDAVIQRAAAVHRVRQVRRLGAPELLDQRRIRPPKAAMNGQQRRIVDHVGLL